LISIRPFQPGDWPSLWQLLHATFQRGDTYAYAPEASEAEVHAGWIEVPEETFVAVEPDGRVVGTFYLKPNQPGLGAHVANCGYVVAADAAGRGIATRLCEHSQVEAAARGYRAIQFNFVVATNERAVRLWQRLGFAVVGRVPGAFRHAQLGYVDVLVMHKALVPEALGVD
jgi:ribosomal protein S18 acetylase RimI-like enzyme